MLTVAAAAVMDAEAVEAVTAVEAVEAVMAVVVVGDAPRMSGAEVAAMDADATAVTAVIMAAVAAVDAGVVGACTPGECPFVDKHPSSRTDRAWLMCTAMPTSAMLKPPRSDSW